MGIITWERVRRERKPVAARALSTWRRKKEGLFFVFKNILAKLCELIMNDFGGVFKYDVGGGGVPFLTGCH